MAKSHYLIEEFAQAGKTSYDELSLEQKKAISAALLRELWAKDKSAVLVDADRESELPDLIAAVLEDDMNLSKILALTLLLRRLFVIGDYPMTKRYDGYFAEQVDERLACAVERITREGRIQACELAYLDARGRGQDMQQELQA